LSEKDFDEIFTSKYDRLLSNPKISCHEVFEFKDYFKEKELITLRLICYYCGTESKAGLEGLVPYWQKEYEASTKSLGKKYEKKQNFDNVLELHGKPKMVISIKGAESSGEMRKACLINPLLNKYKYGFINKVEEDQKFKVGERAPVALQDMGRIWNVKLYSAFNHACFGSIFFCINKNCA